MNNTDATKKTFDLAKQLHEVAHELLTKSHDCPPNIIDGLGMIESMAKKLVAQLDVSCHAPLAMSCSRALVVEDTEVNQIVAQRFLKKLGCQEVDIAPGGGQALELLAKSPYDFVLMDLEMPGMDGYETVRRLRSGEAGDKASTTPVIALTGHATDTTRTYCIEGGMNGFLTKPLALEALRASLEEAMGLANGEPSKLTGESCESGYPLLDQAAALLKIEGDEEIYQDLLAAFMLEHPTTMEEARAAFARNDYTAIRDVAHKMKNLYKAIGAMSCGALSSCLESAAKIKDMGEARKTFADLEEEAERLMPMLQG